MDKKHTKFFLHDSQGKGLNEWSDGFPDFVHAEGPYIFNLPDRLKGFTVGDYAKMYCNYIQTSRDKADWFKQGKVVVTPGLWETDYKAANLSHLSEEDFINILPDGNKE